MAKLTQEQINYIIEESQKEIHRLIKAQPHKEEFITSEMFFLLVDRILHDIKEKYIKEIN